MYHLGIVRPGATIQLAFGSFAGTTGAPSAATGLAAADIQVFKDGSATQRASAAGITVAADFDALTGVNTVTIDLADNTTAGFWAAGSRYVVVVSDITVDSQTVRFPLAAFTIGLSGAVLATTIATLATQASFTLTAGPAEDNALVGSVVYLHDVASAVQGAYGVVTGYTGSTRTVTLAAAPTFTIAAADNIMFMPPANVTHVAGTAYATALAAEVDAVWDEVIEGTVTARQSVRIANAANSGVTSGMATTTALIQNQAGTKTRMTATVDANGNRSAVTYTDLT